MLRMKTGKRKAPAFYCMERFWVGTSSSQLPVRIVVLLAAVLGGVAHATTVTFEDLSIPTPPGYINGDTGSVPSGQSVSTPLAAGGLSFSNTFTNDYGGYWTGFSFSNVVDTTTQGYGNQYASYPGGGYSGSANYAVAYGDGATIALPVAGVVSGFEIANTTFAYLSMRDGDSFQDPFTLGSWFLVTATGSLQNALTGSAGFYLADLRTGSSPGILAGWSWFDLSGLGTVDSVSFAFTGSATGLYGLNTPAYFAADNITYVPSSVPEIDPASLGNVAAVLMGTLGLLERRRLVVRSKTLSKRLSL